MNLSKILIANRGEIAIRIAHTAAELGIQTVAVYPEDDAQSLHCFKCDEQSLLPGQGVAAYLDGEAILTAAKSCGADAVHPGYGFLSENAAFARACADAGVTFIGPAPETLELFGDKHQARALAEQLEVPVLPGTTSPTDLATAQAFMKDQGAGTAVMVKAVAGGGGRGMRPVQSAEELEEAMTRAASEALRGFGDDRLFVERLVDQAKHIEVQILGDGSAVSHLWERDCSLQRRRQKIVEIAPAVGLADSTRQALRDAAMKLTHAVNYKGLCTVEFLVDGNSGDFYFIEANPRLQVEHTVSEEITGVNLVAVQFALASGDSLQDLGLTSDRVPSPHGSAVQLRLNMERMDDAGEVKPSGGVLSAYHPPSGPGVRVDGYGYTGYRSNPGYDSLLAKLIVKSPTADLPKLFDKAYRALCEFQIAGIDSNRGLLQGLLQDPDIRQGHFYTDLIDHNAGLYLKDADEHRELYVDPNRKPDGGASAGGAGVKIDRSDPLAVLAFGQEGTSAMAARDEQAEADLGADEIAVRAPLQGTILSIAIEPGHPVAKGAELAIMDAMKMEHVITAPAAGTIRTVTAGPGDALWEEQLLMILTPGEVDADETIIETEIDPDFIRPDLKEILDRRALTLDAARPQAVERRRKTGQRTVRENVDDLLDPGSFVEYGPLVVAAQRNRRGLEDLLTRSPADGFVTGVGTINGDQFDQPHSSAAVMAYDYTVFAGTQGVHNHWKTDRLLHVAERSRLPLIVFTEGGGGRPGDDDYGGFIGQNTFNHFGKLSGLVPMIGINSGRCFAGNAALLGACDVVIATANSNIGMGGPAMVEGGGLGVFAPEDIGPMSVQVPSGVVDIAVADEAEAVAMTKKYLSYFQGTKKNWTAPDQRRLRHLIPENRLRIYDIRDVIETLADEDSVLELRPEFGMTMVTSFIRVEGRPMGLIANNPVYLGGAIDSDGSDKASRFMQLCDAFDIPILNLCDTPGIMVGPEVEKTALVRHAARMFLVACNMTVPFFTVVLRKAYGLGGIAMAGGNYNAPLFTVSWPTGEFGPMGLEGQVKLGYRAELAAIEDADERQEYFEEMVAELYRTGKALERSTYFNVDDTIDPAETRHWLLNLLAAQPAPVPRDGKKRPMIDAW